MAIFQNDPLSGRVDYSQYLSWKKITLPSGEVLYEIPGAPHLTYDPIRSSASGRTVLRRNPAQAIQEQQEVKDAQKKQLKQQEFNQSPLGQLLPVGTAVGGTVAAAHLIPQAASPVEQIIASQLASQGAAGAAAQGVAGTTASGGLAGAIAPATPNLIGASVIPSGTAASGAAAPTILGNAAGMGILPIAGIAAGTYLGGEAAYDMYKGRKANPVGRATLAIATGGLSEIAKAAGLFGHKSTRERQSDVTKHLMEQAGDDPAAQAYVAGMREQFNAAPPDPSKPFAGKYSSWDEYQKAGLEASDLTGVEGNIETYTPQVWANLTQEQRQAVTQANIESGLYNSKDGGVQITDKDKAKENYDNVMKGFEVGVQTATTPAQAAAAGAIRSTTLSPGIGLNGLPIPVQKLNPALRR